MFLYHDEKPSGGVQNRQADGGRGGVWIGEELVNRRLAREIQETPQALPDKADDASTLVQSLAAAKVSSGGASQLV